MGMAGRGGVATPLVANERRALAFRCPMTAVSSRLTARTKDAARNSVLKEMY